MAIKQWLKTSHFSLFRLDFVLALLGFRNVMSRYQNTHLHIRFQVVSNPGYVVFIIYGDTYWCIKSGNAISQAQDNEGPCDELRSHVAVH